MPYARNNISLKLESFPSLLSASSTAKSLRELYQFELSLARQRLPPSPLSPSPSSLSAVYVFFCFVTHNAASIRQRLPPSPLSPSPSPLSAIYVFFCFVILTHTHRVLKPVTVFKAFVPACCRVCVWMLRHTNVFVVQ